MNFWLRIAIDIVLCIKLKYFSSRTVIVKKFWPKLCDKKSRKSDVWSAIACEMDKLGYIISSATPGTSCANKWQNLSRGYKQFSSKLEQTGSSADILKQKPPHYDLIHEILGKKSYCYLTFLLF